MATAGDQINRALRLLGVLAEGETASSETANDALVALNQMLDSWSTERLSVYATQDQVITWPANTRTRTIGPTGDLVARRPIAVDPATYFLVPGTNVSYGIKLINQEQYDSIGVKTITSMLPQLMFVNEGMPNIEVSLYPVPNRDLEFHFISVEELAQPATLDTVLAFPPGYMRAFAYNLAVELAAEFGTEPAPSVVKIAMSAKRALKRVNSPGDVMSLPYALVSTANRFNIYSGSPQ